MNTNTFIQLQDFIDNKEESTKQIQADMLMAHSRVMIMMFNATNEVRYLDRSVQDLLEAESILRSGFMRPLGALLMSA